jgi:hypothetical protein
MKVYKIKLEGDYNDYYVTANDFNEAEKKICIQKNKEIEEKKETTNIFTDDGSLKPEISGQMNENKPIVVKIIEMLTDKVIS